MSWNCAGLTYGRVVTSSCMPARFLLLGTDMTKRQTRMLREVIDDINRVIDKVHSIRMDFFKGSVEQRLISELDGARTTTRAIINQTETTNVRKPPHPQIKHTDG